ncbi:MAG TPA: hypothetical protein VMF51_17025 [Nocardioides sp.]|uniref:hypothetical protein n=1 Tax=Nocardioides sp. TaxID=35761 RepID=UPI002BECF6B8|nr:hypothetical protein [Nocardioides sp.]HTW16839.1 hypothetical protein [Nocardioides sp.]
MTSSPSLHPFLDDPLTAPQPTAAAETTLDPATVRDTLRSMAALTRVVLGVALQAPADPAGSAGSETSDADPTLAPEPAPPPDSIALPADLLAETARPLNVVPPAVPAPSPLDDDWTPTLSAVPRLAVVETAAPLPERQNLGLLQEIAFLDD